MFRKLPSGIFLDKNTPDNPLTPNTMNTNYIKIAVLQFSLLLLTFNINAQYNPVSDPSNNDGWIFNPDLSDEFNGSTLDKDKWWILGENDDYRSKWKGRAPGQFVPHNVSVSGGDLILQSQWEPNYDFLDESDHSGNPYGGGKNGGGEWIKPITQSCIMSEKFFKYGYMEVRCKSADAPVTSAFWTTGYHSEFDMTENYGKRPIGYSGGTALEYKYRTNLISWDPERAPGAAAESYKTEHTLAERHASDYFVFGFEWDPEYIKIYFEGNLLETKTRAQLENGGLEWVWNNPQELWLDKEVFSWYGLPNQADLASPAQYKVDYVRIWQKELLSGDDFNALGFEGPFYYSGRSTNWWSGTGKWTMRDEKPLSGDFSLRFKNSGTLSGNHTVFAPYGSLDLPAGNNTMNMSVWIDPATTVSEINVTLRNPWKQFTVDISGITKGQWVTVSTPFSRGAASNPSITNGDRIELQIQSGDVSGSNTLLYIDDIYFGDQPLSVGEEKTSNKFNIYPNPASDYITVVSSGNGNISITNNIGATVKTLNNVNVSEQIFVGDLAAGIYFVTANNNGKSEVKKVIIQ